MGCTLMTKGLICLKPSSRFFQHKCANYFTPTTFLWKPPLSLSYAHRMSTRNNSNVDGKQAEQLRNWRRRDDQDGMKNKSDRRHEMDLRDRGVGGNRKSQAVYLPKSVFVAGTAKRTAELQKKRYPSDEEESRGKKSKEKLQLPDRPLSVDEWRKVIESRRNPVRFGCHMMDALAVSNADLDIAKSLLTFFVSDTGTLPYELLMRYAAMCDSGGHREEIYDVYNIMRGAFPSLDTGALGFFIKVFCRTERWTEAISLLNEIKKVLNPAVSSFCHIIEAAAEHGDMTTAWALYDEMVERKLLPHQKTWEVLLGVGQKAEGEGLAKEDGFRERLEGILHYMRNNQIYPIKATAQAIKAWFESRTDETWTGTWTTSTQKGLCKCCGLKLESIQLTPEEYRQLKDKVMTDVIQGQDVFKKTTPQELQVFKEFVKKTPPFDVVVDGLNVANIANDKSQLSNVLLMVVSELKQQGLAILVLGRKHMLRPGKIWDRKNLTSIQTKAHCFFTDNISEDDPFLLYAALHSGNHCQFVSRDLMRDHKACLPDMVTRRLFFKWQRGHQLVVNKVAANQVYFQSIPCYDTIVQTTGDSWHIPYDNTEDRSTYEVPQTWLCLSKKR